MHGDELRMKLYLGEVQSGSASVPVFKYLWESLRQTSVFNQARSGVDGANSALAEALTFGAGRAAQASINTLDSARVELITSEWRLLLLFLELFIFVQRLMDDDDFFFAVNQEARIDLGVEPSRLQKCSLPLPQLRELTMSLKHLAVGFYCHLEDIEKTLKLSGDAARTAEAQFAGVGKPGVESVRRAVTLALQIIRERDSRQPFVREDEWYDGFSLENREQFITTVVANDPSANDGSEAGDSDVEMSDAEDDSDSDEMFKERKPVEAEPERLSMTDTGYELSPRYISRSRELAQAHGREPVANQRYRAAGQSALTNRLTSRIAVLDHLPFVIPFDTRVAIFRALVREDLYRRRRPEHSLNYRHHADISRDQVLETAFSEFWKLGEGLKDPISITFFDRFGDEEAGIDGGGVTKEFLMAFAAEAFSLKPSKPYGISYFLANDQNMVFPNPLALEEAAAVERIAAFAPPTPAQIQNLEQKVLQRYEFIGRVVGKCLYEGILLDVAFAPFFLKKWVLSRHGDRNRMTVSDLRSLDMGLYEGLMKLKSVSDVASLDLDFSIQDRWKAPNFEGTKETVRTVELMPGASGVRVTSGNRPLYIHYVSRYRLERQGARQTAAFLRGIEAMIDPGWLTRFGPAELQRLVGGDSSEIDVEDLRKNTHYSGVYEIGTDGLEHPTVQHFWRVLRALPDKDRRAVIKYVTSTPRAPLQGFAQLRPLFTIRDAGQDEGRLPSASTCVNMLKLPQYRTEETLKERLLYAVRSGAGFDLS